MTNASSKLNISGGYNGALPHGYITDENVIYIFKRFIDMASDDQIADLKDLLNESKGDVSYENIVINTGNFWPDLTIYSMIPVTQRNYSKVKNVTIDMRQHLLDKYTLETLIRVLHTMPNIKSVTFIINEKSQTFNNEMQSYLGVDAKNPEEYINSIPHVNEFPDVSITFDHLTE